MAGRRTPVRRRGNRRTARRGSTNWPAGALAALVAISAAGAVVRWLAAHWWLLAVALAAAGAAAAVAAHRRVRAARQRQLLAAQLRLALTGPGGIDQMAPDAFEYAVRDLLLRDGCRARKVGRANDQSVDVLAEDPTGRRWAVQCKHKQDPVGGRPVSVGVLYALAGTYRRSHGAHVAVVVTNGRFSRESLKWGAEHGILLVDRTSLARWAAGGRPLWEVLPRVPAPRDGHRR
ncbi:restriction endonuclease [Kitasatospora misakiensis]|uniref:Restriction endonuclease n=1 Tax=Kitasatospora misakiensis TaxID=67330 RepID=A0ABW0WWF9_9ACTN